MLDRRTTLTAIGGLLAGAILTEGCATGSVDNRRSNVAAMNNKASYLAAKAAYNARDLDRCLSFYAPDHQIIHALAL